MSHKTSKKEESTKQYRPVQSDISKSCSIQPTDNNIQVLSGQEQ
jgi:hypothetical protein